MRLPLKLSLLIVSVGTWFGAGTMAQTGGSVKAKWNLRNGCREVRLEHTALVTERRAGFFTCQNYSDAEHMAELESIPGKIPFVSIKSIIRQEVIRKPVQEEIDRSLYSLQPENLPSTIGEAADAGMFALVAPVGLLTEAGTLAPFHGIKKHLALVWIIWTENGAERSTSLLLARKDAESLLEQLAQATGKSWSEVRFDSRAVEKRNLELIVHFNKPVDLGEVTVFGGSYKFLIVTASDSTRLVYVFPEDYRSSEDAVMVLTATVSPLSSGKPWKVNLVHTTEESFCLFEIHTDTERLELSACGKSRSF